MRRPEGRSQKRQFHVTYVYSFDENTYMVRAIDVDCTVGTVGGTRVLQYGMEGSLDGLSSGDGF